jgi:hypothetical protein
MGQGKNDRQIVAIARVCGARTIYSDDGHVASLAKDAKINIITIWELPLPPAAAQIDMFAEGRALAPQDQTSAP